VKVSHSLLQYLTTKQQSYLKTVVCMSLLGGIHSALGADLLEVYHKAQENDPTFASALYTYAGARQKIPQARAALLPVLNLNGNDNKTKATALYGQPPAVNRNIWAWSWSLQLTQPLINFQNIYSLSAAEMQVEQAHAQYNQAEQDLILRVTQAYFDILVAQETIEVAQAQINATAEQLELAKHGFDAGTNAITDVDEAKSRSGLARSQYVAAMNDLDAKNAELDKLMEQAPKTLAPLNAAAVIPRPVPDNVKEWIAQARESNPAVMAPLAALGVAQAEVRKNRADYLPTLNAVASYGNSYSSGSLTLPVDYATRVNSGEIGLQLNVPLFAGGSTNSHVKEALANEGKTISELEVARRQSATDAKKAYAAIVNGLAQIEALESAVESSKSAVKGNQIGYKLGIHMNIDVLNAEQQLYTAQRDLIKARYDTLLQGLKLKAAAGVLSEADVEMVNGMLLH
jgi:outer membrane protein